MTPEEAGQAILENEPYTGCVPCVVRRRNGGGILNSDCVICKGWGKVPRREHIEACKLLGIAPPLSLDEAEEIRLDAYMRSKPEFYGEQLKIIDGMRRR